jgi:hypothetical protein
VHDLVCYSDDGERGEVGWVFGVVQGELMDCAASGDGEDDVR